MFLSRSATVARSIEQAGEFLAKAAVAVYNDIDWTQPANEIDDDLRILRNTDRIVKIVAQAISFAFLLAVVWWGIPEVHDTIRYEVRTESLAFPMWPFLLTLLVGFAFMAVSMFFQIYRGIQKLRGVSVLEEPSET